MKLLHDRGHDGTALGRRAAPWIFALALLGAACSESDDDSTVAPPTQTALTLTVEATQLAAGVGDTFDLTGVVLNPPEEPFELVWNADDGQFAIGDAFAPSFAAAGTRLVEVDLRLVDTFEVLTSAAVALTVLDPASPQGVLGEPMPALPGDLDGDGSLTAVDLLQVRQYLAGLALLPDADTVERADVDRDGKVNEVDAELLANSILTDSAVATAVVPAAARPGQRMQLFSPALLEASPKFEIEFPGLDPFEPLRLVPGQVSFFVPFDVLTPGRLTLDPGATVLRLLADGQAVEEFSFGVLEAPQVPAQPLAEVFLTLDRLPAWRAEVEAQLATLEVAPGLDAVGLAPQDVEVLRLALAEIHQVQAAAEAGLREGLEALTADQREVVGRLLYANGFAPLEPLAPNALGGDAIAVLCAFQAGAEALEQANDDVGLACSALGILAVGSLGVGAVFPPALILSALSFQAFTGCASALAASEFAQILMDLVPDLGNELVLETPNGTSASPGEPLRLDPKVPIVGLAELCDLAQGAAVGKGIEEFLAEPITEAILKKYPIKPVFDQVKALSSAAAEFLEETIEDIVEGILGQTPAGQWIADVGSKVCDFAVGDLSGNVDLVPAFVTISDSPSGGSFGTDDDFIYYTCAPDPEPTVELQGSVPLCGQVVTQTMIVECGDLVPVSITMGDNGSLTDDIFEVVIDGDSVLTSSSPVTSISTTVDLAPGDYVFQMKGLAAPDGIGTYFVSVSGGALSGGPPLSGSDLIAGAVFTWNLNVPNN
jgi:hypothetical protein